MKKSRKTNFSENNKTTVNVPKYFAGSFSGKGFTNYLTNALETVKKIYIIKGTAGSGKSTLMKKIASAAEASGEKVERIYCSSDINSLDGVVIPSLSFAIVDGTAPHVLEPSYPLARETIVNTADYIDSAKIEKQKENIIYYSDKKKSLFKEAELLLKSFSSLESLKTSILERCYDSKKGFDFSRNIISGEAKTVEPTNEAKAIKRSLVSFNKNGISTLFDSLKPKKTFKIDEYFAPFVLGTLKLLCEEYKINVIYSPSPLEPSQICAVYFPETERLFADSRFFEQTSENKENLELIHRNRFSLEYALKENKEKLNFISKTEKHVLAEAKEYLREAMVYHSLLEGIYSPSLNKNALDCLAQSLIVSIFK